MSNHPRQACVNCHFFTEIHAVANGPLPLEINDGKRAKARQNDFTWINRIMSLKCSRLVWSDGFGATTDRFQSIVETDPTDFCFFLPYHPGMLDPAGVELEKRISEAKEAKKDRRWIAYGVWVAVIAIVVQAILSVIGLILSASGH
jgi:hypothetical protein